MLENNVNYNINRLQKHMILSVDAENTSDKIHYLFMSFTTYSWNFLV